MYELFYETWFPRSTTTSGGVGRSPNLRKEFMVWPLLENIKNFPFLLIKRYDVCINHIIWEKWCLPGSRIDMSRLILYFMKIYIAITCIRCIKLMTFLITCFIVLLMSNGSMFVYFQLWFKCFKWIIIVSNGSTWKWF